MRKISANDLDAVQSKMTAALAIARSAQAALDERSHRSALAPCYDHCARELERAAQAIRAMADEAAATTHDLTCSS